MKEKVRRIVELYNRMTAPVKASIWFTVCSIMQKGITLLSTPIFTRLLTTEQYGVYSVYQSWYSIISIFATLNLSAGVLFNGLTKYPGDRNRLISSFQGLSTTVTFLIFIVYISAINYWNNLLGMNTLFIMAMFIELLVVPAYAFWAVRQRYDYKYIKLITLTVLVAFGSPLLGVLAVISTDYKAEARVLSYVFIQVVQGLFFYIYNMIKGKTFYHKKYWKFALRFNLPLIPHYLSMTILNQADRIMISKMISTDVAAIYSVAYQVSMMMTIVTNAINSSFVPYTYKELKAHNYKGIKRNSNLLLVLIGVACVVAMAFGPEIVRIFAAPEYYDAIWVIPPVAASVYFIFLYSLFANIEFYFEKTKFVMIASCGGAIANIVLNYLLIPCFGYYAAGYTTLACYIMFSFAHYYFYRKVLKQQKCVKNVYNNLFVVGFSVIIILFMLIMPLLYNYIYLRFALIILLLVSVILNRKKISKVLVALKKERS